MRSTHTRGRDTLRPTFREARAQSDPSSTTFLSKKKFNDSAPTTDRALTCWTKSKRRRKCDAVSLELIQCFKDFWLWESHSSYLLVAQYSLFISTYPRPVSEWVIDSFRLEIAIASPSFAILLALCSKSDDFRPQPVLQGGEGRQWTWNISITFYRAADYLFFCWTMQ